jgi:hypothetical protein
MHLDLDVSAVDDSENLNEYFEKIPMYFVFVDKTGSISSVEKEDYYFPDSSSDSSLDDDQKIPFLSLFQQVKTMSKDGQYKLKDTLVFNVDLENEEIIDFVGSKSFDDSKYLRVFTFLDDIVILPSISQLKSIQGIYFIMAENEIQKTNKPRISLLDEEFKDNSVIDMNLPKTRKHYSKLCRITRKRHEI